MKNFNRYHHYANLWNDFLTKQETFSFDDFIKEKLPYGSNMLSMLLDNEHGCLIKIAGHRIGSEYVKRRYKFNGKLLDHTYFEKCRNLCNQRSNGSKIKTNTEQNIEQKGSFINKDRLNELSLEKITRLLLSHTEYNSEKFLVTYFMPEELAYALRHHGYTLTATKLIEL